MMFNIRVYGILINDEKQVLVVDEFIRGKYYTKFPGGGLELGEGTRDCLKREFKEEMNIEVEVREHLYTTDFYQPSAFNPSHQIVSIYYLVNPLEELNIPLKNQFKPEEKRNKTHEQDEEIEEFRFIEWNKFSEDSVTLPIDKVAVKFIKEKYS
jgi:ADP-ribose pyrophosphatase YjhB (NUDIX family)